MEKGISYLNRTFNDYRDSLMGFTKQYYPELVNEFNDASVGSWMLDVVASIADNLSYHIDRVYQETNLDSASEKSSVYAMARNNGIKIPGPTASMAEVKFTCELPLIIKSGDKGPDWSYAPIIKRGTKVSSGNQIFELLNDINFAEQFNEDGISNRTIIPKQNSNKYVITKTGIVSAGETKIYTKTIKSSDITPFMSFIIPDTDVMNVESIIFKDGVNHTCPPSMLEFMYPNEIYSGTNKNKLWRFFEVDYLAQQYKWDDVIVDGKPEKVTVDETINGVDVHLSTCTKGEWKPLRQKFITEFTDKGYLKVIFGAGDMSGTKMDNVDDMEKPSYVISHMINNDGLGVLPNANTTMYVMYRRGGGATSNIAEGAITNINYLNMSLSGANSSYVTEVKRSLSVTNTSPSVSGKDMPSINEIKNLIKYNNGAQNRCVTVKDYHSRILQMPPRYGCPFRVGVSEENNKIMVYLLGLDANGKLTDVLPEVLCKNIMNYLSEYCMVNDFVEIKSGRIIDLQFEVDLFVDKNYNTSDVVSNVINTISNYMDINNRDMGTNIFVGDIEKEISKVDGVENLIELRVYNIYGNGYSQTRTSQQTMTYDDCASNSEDGDSGEEENRSRIDLKASDKTLYCENETMLEIKNEKTDIICRVKTR